MRKDKRALKALNAQKAVFDKTEQKPDSKIEKKNKHNNADSEANVSNKDRKRKHKNKKHEGEKHQKTE